MTHPIRFHPIISKTKVIAPKIKLLVCRVTSHHISPPPYTYNFVSTFILGATFLVLEIIGWNLFGWVTNYPNYWFLLKKRRRNRCSRRPPLFTAATKKKFFIAFLAELGNLESFETMLFFFKIFRLTSIPAGILVIFFKFSKKITWSQMIPNCLI